MGLRETIKCISVTWVRTREPRDLQMAENFEKYCTTSAPTSSRYGLPRRDSCSRQTLVRHAGKERKNNGKLKPFKNGESVVVGGIWEWSKFKRRNECSGYIEAIFVDGENLKSIST